MRTVALLVGVIASLALGLSVAYGAVDEGVGPVSVKVKATKVRAEAKAWAAAIGALKYGDSIQALSVSDGWLKVRTSGGKQGYLHESAVTTKKIVLSSRGGGSDSAADRADVVLAGKGFSQAIERDLAAQDSSLNFKGVDEMERLRVSDVELAAFIKAGHLGKRG